ncbi:MAG: chorismate lyase [gamma proteobacterium symbiont of Bathyaustriella thionipta]|nr:chorismate lyase [gamma proteobacterium symbiont of Bathyaustriella thionipta]
MLNEPRWFLAGNSKQLGIPPPVYDWLSDSGSLTTRLMSGCGPSFRVHLQQNDFQRAWLSEMSRLNMRSGSWALLRHVSLECGDDSWVFARTVIPVGSLRGSARRLAFLGERPLGHLLFIDPGAQRLQTEYARLLPRHALFQLALQQSAETAQELWARRTLYRMAGHLLLVNEVYLAELLA